MLGLSSVAFKAKLGEILLPIKGFKPANTEATVPLVYVAYYYLEALLRYQALNKIGKN